MDVRHFITEEIADQILKVSDQSNKVKRSIETYESETDETAKVKKRMLAEKEKQKLYKLQVELLKEKVAASKSQMAEMSVRLKILQQRDN